MRLRVLGPLEVHAAGVELPPGTRKRQVVLALLAVNANRVVTIDELVDELWPAEPPASAAANVRGYVGQLRRLFGSVEPGRDRLVRHGLGYVLRADADEVDLQAFAALAEAGREDLRRGEAKLAANRFGEALACWRGPMLAGLPHGPALAARCAVMDDERLAITEELAALQLDLDEPREVVDLLREHVLAHPLRERARLLLMRALHRLGDTPAALALFGEGRAALREQLGLEPGPELQQLHRAILSGQPDRVQPAPAPARGPVPAQLPLDVYGFTGRARELDQLDAVLAAAGEQPTAVVISAIAGTAGVGKTATAVHWAHRAREEFPDGQLYVNLRGFDPSGSPVSPAEAVRGFLDALDVPPARLPADVESQSGLYRSLLATRRVLIVLDNARDAEQVRPLLPGSQGCLVVVTSRNQLTGLVAAEGAHPVTLDLLTIPDARALLARRLGADRVAAEPEAVEQIITRCARLPLALAIVAARAAARPALPLTALAAEFHDALDALATDDVVTNLRAVFSWSFEALSQPVARLFRLLGLHPGPDISTAAAASLAGLPVEQVRPLLAELSRANLLNEPTPGRYTLHDLLRAYAAEQGAALDNDAECRAGTHRLLDHYLHTAHAASFLLQRHQQVIKLDPAAPGVTLEDLADDEEAQAWFIREHRVLLAVFTDAVRAGYDAQTSRLAQVLSLFLDREGHWEDLLATQQEALGAAERLDDVAGMAYAQRDIGAVHLETGCLDKAHVHYRHAADLFDRAGDRFGQACAHMGTAVVYNRQGRPADALRHAEVALQLFRDVGNRAKQSHALTSISLYCVKTGDHQKAVVTCHRAIAIQRELGDRHGEACTWDNLGYAHHHLGEYREATACFRRALELFEHAGGRHAAAETLIHLGETYHATADVTAERAAWQQALDILVELGHPAAEDVRTRLTRLDQGSSTSGTT